MKTVMKAILGALFFMIVATMSFAQNNSSFFKVFPTGIGSAPQWAQLMYSANPNIEEVNDLYDAYYRTNKLVKTIHTQNYKYWLKVTRQYIDLDGYIKVPTEAELYNEMNSIQSSGQEKKSQHWVNIGPNNTYKNDGSLNLRPTQTNIYTIAVAPSNTDILYAGTEGGGIFKSVDHGQTWFLTSSDYPITVATDIKVHPVTPDIVYIATGANIYITTDGGLTWALNYTAAGTVEQFYIHYTQPNIVYAATASGLLKTVDDGVTWNNIFNERCWDIEPHAMDPNTIYLSISNIPAKRAEIYKSTDNGVNWTLKDNMWYVPTDINNASDIGCKIGITPADTGRVYAGLIGDSKAGDNGWIGIYYSLDGADTWVNADGIDGGPYVAGNDMMTNWYVAGYNNGYHQGWYNFDLDVSHIDPDKLWVGTIWACESGNRGANIEYIRGTRNLEMHADVQDIDVLGNEIWYTSDGGINYSTDEMLTVEIRNTGISASTYWGFDHGWNEDVWTGGRYHNGNAVYHEGYGVGNTLFLGGAEEATGYINPLNNRTTYFSDISDKNVKPNLSEVSTNRASISKYPNQAYTILNSSEIVFHPNYANVMFLGADNVFYRSTSAGAKFDTLYTFSATARVLEIEISWSNPQVIYCIVRDGGVGRIYRSSNGGNSFNQMTAIPSNNQSRLDVTLDPHNENNLWVSTYYGANGQKVYNSTDGGLVWVNKTTASLDGHSILDILYQGGTNDAVYVLTNYGVLVWDGASSWTDYSVGLPYYTRGLRFKPFYRDNKLRMSSDRGVWEADFLVESAPMAHPMVASEFVYCIRDTIQFEDHSFLNHTNATWAWNFIPAPAYVSNPNARNPKVLFDVAGTYDVLLAVTDQNGVTSTDTIIDMITVENKCFTDTIPGLSMLCQANNGHALVPDLDLPQTDSLTLSAWIKPTGIQDSYSGIVFNDGASAGINFRAGNELAYHWPGGQWWWSSGLIVDTNQWSHVVLVAKPTGITIYLNGIASTHNFSLSPADIGTMRIGSYKGWTSRNYRGEIDEVCIWNRALSQEEIRELRHLTRTGTTPFTDDLVAYYQFNLNTTDVLDRININHASLNGTAQKVLSTAPIAGGESHRLTVNSAGPQTFGPTQAQVTFGTINPNGEVVLSRLNLLPDSLPSNNPNTGNYWVINNYGSEPFDPLTALKLKSVNGYPIGNPADSRLFVRSANEDINNWVELCAAADFNGNSYNYNSSCGIANTGQFFVQSGNANPIHMIYPYAYVNEQICDNDSIYLQGAYQFLSGIYTDTVNYAVNVDSVVVTTLSVMPLPQVTIDPIPDVCENDNSFVLNYGTPTGGTYSGTGVSGTLFDPSVAGSGTWTIMYSYTDGFGCTNEASTTLSVMPLPQVTIDPIPDVCENDNSFVLNYGTPTGGTYSGTGVSGTLFDPSVAGLGTWTITYSYTDGFGCTNEAATDVFVDGCLGIDAPTIDGIFISPNPTDGNVDVGAVMDVERLEVVDEIGRIVTVHYNLKANEVVTIDLTAYAVGMYSVVVITKEGVLHARIMKH